jgi:D-inositol-3-phosphate glycosyltransferase
VSPLPLRIALVSEHANPIAPVGHPETGGQNVYVDALARHLGRLGCEVDVYTRRASGDEPPCVAVASGVTVHHVPAGPARAVPRDELLPLMPEFAERLARGWTTRPPDVVHAHFWMSGWASKLAAAGTGAPVVQTFHALGTVKRRHQGPADTSPPERAAVERDLLQTVDGVIATCRDEVAELRRMAAGAGASHRITVVPCGVSDTFSPLGPVAERGRRLRLVTVSRLVPRKGIADVVRAVALLRHDVELVVVGDAAEAGDGSAVADLRTLAGHLGIADRVVLAGRMEAPDVAATMRSADVVVCAPWYEPFGIVPVEAMACGVPVVGTAVGGLLDTVVDGVTGLLVPPRCPDRLAQALDRLLADAAARRRLGSAGAARAQRYRWPHVARAVLQAYHRVLDRAVDADPEAAFA